MVFQYLEKFGNTQRWLLPLLGHHRKSATQSAVNDFKIGGTADHYIITLNLHQLSILNPLQPNE